MGRNGLPAVLDSWRPTFSLRSVPRIPFLSFHFCNHHEVVFVKPQSLTNLLYHSELYVGICVDLPSGISLLIFAHLGSHSSWINGIFIILLNPKFISMYRVLFNTHRWQNGNGKLPNTCKRGLKLMFDGSNNNRMEMLNFWWKELESRKSFFSYQNFNLVLWCFLRRGPWSCCLYVIP